MGDSRKDEVEMSMTNEDLICQVGQLQDTDEEVYRIIERYYDRYEVIPTIRDVQEQAGILTEIETFQSEMRLVSAGCLLSDNSGLRMIPLISPFEAKDWCGTDHYSIEACERKLDLMIIEYTYRHDGDWPTIDILMEKYRRSVLFPIIKERALHCIRDSFVLTEEVPPQVKFSKKRKARIRQVLSAMETPSALSAS